jgi:hypothetical protein
MTVLDSIEALFGKSFGSKQQFIRGYPSDSDCHYTFEVRIDSVESFVHLMLMMIP